MVTVTQSTTPVSWFHIDTFEDSFGLPDGESVTCFQAYDVATSTPVGPHHGDPNPAYVRSYMRERFPAAVERRAAATRRR